ncbi:MAG: glycosyltransferase, partial [Actinomycetota bacterium]|nr:glycosyltransferase [Actinomycetota bacterium]
VPPGRLPPVAILMTVRDDFSEAAAAAMLRTDYPRWRLYLCDDSTTAVGRDRVDRFAGGAGPRVEVIRRGAPTGFKAGNLNHALRCGAIGESLLLIADSDERFEPAQLRALVDELERWKPAFVQASHGGVRDGGSDFQRTLAPSVATCWRVYEHPRNREGLPFFLGHGVVIPAELVQAVGGFSELTTSEDIDLTYRLAFAPERVHRGRVSEEVFAQEEVPPSLRHYRRRFHRWMRQDARYAPIAAGQIWRGRRRVAPLEALDLVAKQLHIPVCGLAEAYLLALGVLLLATQSHAHEWPIALAAVGLLAALAPVMPVLVLGDTGLRERVRAAACSVRVFDSLLLGGTRVLLGSLRRPRSFVPTGAGMPGVTGRADAAVALGLTALSALAACALLAAMSLAALGAALTGRGAAVANGGAAVTLVVGLAQLPGSPEHALALLPLGAARY